MKIKLKPNPKIGLNKNTILFIGPKKVRALENSFTASAAGWSIPQTPTLLGPTRIWPSPKTFRSKRVKKATLIKTGIMVTLKSSKYKISLMGLESYKKNNFTKVNRRVTTTLPPT